MISSSNAVISNPSSYIKLNELSRSAQLVAKETHHKASIVSHLCRVSTADTVLHNHLQESQLTLMRDRNLTMMTYLVDVGIEKPPRSEFAQLEEGNA